MKISYEAASGSKKGPRYYLRCENSEEMRWITILRDILEGDTKGRIRFCGSEKVGKKVAGMPANPVQAIGLEIESTNEATESLDPSLPVRNQASPSQVIKEKLRRLRG